MLKDKTALVTGSARGIGKAIAVALAKEGANIIINDTKPSARAAEKTANEIRECNVQVDCFLGDISKFVRVKEITKIIEKKYDRVDILVNNAAITKDRTLRNMLPVEWNSVIGTNLTGIYNVTHNLLPLIPDKGRIINISSVVGFGGYFGQCNYSASKGGVIAFTGALAKELAKRGITVNAIAPGFIESNMSSKLPPGRKQKILEMIPMQKMGEPEDVADLAVFLSSDRARYITGEVIRIDGGLLFRP